MITNTGSCMVGVEVIVRVNDRGSMKWTTMMLPEHAELLKKLWQEDNKLMKPILDIQEINLLKKRLLFAFENKSIAEVTLYSKYEMKKYNGKIIKIDPYEQVVYMKLGQGDSVFLPFYNIIAIE